LNTYRKEGKFTIIEYVMEPTTMKPRRRPTGPPFLSEEAVPRNRPVPITPPMLRWWAVRCESSKSCGVKIPYHGNVSILELALQLGLAQVSRLSMIEDIALGIV
jgi:hypothetical protein